VEVVTTSGQTLVGQVDNPRGNWDNPAAYEEVKDKFRALTSPIFRDGKSSKAVELFMDLERLSKAGDLTGGLRELGG
jgi:2-methylcitrate dehydratase PrpD